MVSEITQIGETGVFILNIIILYLLIKRNKEIEKYNKTRPPQLKQTPIKNYGLAIYLGVWIIASIISWYFLVKRGQGVENPHAFKHEMNRTPCKGAEMFQGTDGRSIKHEPHNSQQAGIFHTYPKSQRTLRASALSSLQFIKLGEFFALSVIAPCAIVLILEWCQLIR